MTIEEAANQYGTYEKTTSVGDSLATIARMEYRSDSEYYRNIIKILNPGRVDWNNIAPSSVIKLLNTSNRNIEHKW